MTFSSPRDPLPQTQSSAAGTASRLRVAFQGEPGAFSEQAIVQLWGAAAEPIAMHSFGDVMEAADSGQVDYGMLPIESTLVGGVDVAYDLLVLHDGLLVVAETVVEIHLSVLGFPGVAISDLRTLASHPLMLAQCTHFFDRHRAIRRQPSWDTAGAAREVAERGDPTWAAAASSRAGEHVGLVQLADRIEDRPDTMMRFLAVASDPAVLREGTPARTALLCALPNAVGTLVGVLEPLATMNLNVSHLAARPTREPWAYEFYVEFEHDAGDDRMARALKKIRGACRSCRMLGTYPRWSAR